MKDVRPVLVKMAGVSLTLMLHKPASAATDAFFNPGFLFSAGSGENPLGLGGEASVMILGKNDWGYGAFVQAQSYAADYARYAFGFQTGYFFGGEVGFAYLTTSQAHASTFGAHVGGFVSLAVIGAGLRFTVPFSSDSTPALPAHPVEASLVLTLKLPIPLGGTGQRFFQMGRPLRSLDGARLPRVAANRDWSDEATVPRLDALDDCARRRLAAEWLEDARAEHASIGTFSLLCLQLLGLGAPARLLGECQNAARDEVAHAKLCFALATAYAGRALGPGPLDISNLDPSGDFTTLARASFLDGCIGEGFAAKVARCALVPAADATVRRALAVIAADETRHAELAWSIVAWCLARSPATVKPALEAAAHALPPPDAPTSLGAAGNACLSASLRAHGRVPMSERRVLMARAEHRARRRLTRLLVHY